MSFPPLPPRFPFERIGRSGAKSRDVGQKEKGACGSHAATAQPAPSTAKKNKKNTFPRKNGRLRRCGCKWRAGSFRLCIPEVNAWPFPLLRGISEPRLGPQTLPSGIWPLRIIPLGIIVHGLPRSSSDVLDVPMGDGGKGTPVGHLHAPI